jgi:hypothetical protein
MCRGGVDENFEKRRRKNKHEKERKQNEQKDEKIIVNNKPLTNLQKNSKKNFFWLFLKSV